MLDSEGVHDRVPFTSDVTGSTVSGASAWDDMYREWGIRETCNERRCMAGYDASSEGVDDALQGDRKRWPNISYPIQFVPQYGEGSWDESTRVIDACGGGCSDTIIVVSGFHAGQVVGKGGAA